MIPESCDNVYGAKYCIKHVGRFEGKNHSLKSSKIIMINSNLHLTTNT